MLLRVLALALLVIGLGGCQRVTEADKEVALEVVRANVKAMEAEDMDAALATIHPKSPAYEQAREPIATIFKDYDLSYELEKVEVSQVAVAEIRVAFAMVTRRRTGAEGFTDNRVEGFHLVRRDGNGWKIWETRILQATPVEAPPSA